MHWNKPALDHRMCTEACVRVIFRVLGSVLGKIQSVGVKEKIRGHSIVLLKRLYVSFKSIK